MVQSAGAVVFDDERLRIIAKRVKAFRSMEGWTQEELAGRAGVDHTTIKTLERGKKVSLETYGNVAAALGREVFRLLYDEGGQLGSFIRGFMEANHDLKFPSPKADGLVESIFDLDPQITKFLDTHYIEFENRKVLLFEAIGRFFNQQVGEYVQHLEALGMPREQALSFMHMFYVVNLMRQTAACGVVNASRMDAYYREMYDRYFSGIPHLQRVAE